MDNKIFSLPQAARYCSISRGTLWRCVKSGDLKAFLTPGGHYRILKEDLEAFMQAKGMYFSEQDYSDKKKILVVDDDPGIQDILVQWLSGDNFITDVASDGFEAGVKTVQFKPDLMILDLFMPKMDGFEVCKRIKTDPNTAHIKIIVFTGFDTKENRERIMEAGADGLLVKPVDEKTLLQKIKDHLT
jgi:excisionase family DNA binding protein